MSQQPPRKPSGSANNANNTNKTNTNSARPSRPATSAARPTPAQRSSSGARPPAARQPVNAKGQAEETGMRGNINRALPPFSIQRYVVIWLLGMIPLVLVILWLAQPWKASGPLAGLGAGKFMVLETSKGEIIAKLYTDASANVGKTIANFETKATAGFFNNLTFHRVEDWVIQGGDPLGNGTGGGQMPSEYNSLPFAAGALGVARGNDPAINNDSQFFITKSDANYLNTQYTNWGQVVKGMEVVKAIVKGDTITSMSIMENK